MSEDIDVFIDGFNIIQLDKDTAKTRKKIRGQALPSCERENESCSHYELRQQM